MLPAWTSGEASLYLGNCLDILPTLKAGSVQACVTSPPYWGLRDYSLQPSVWGGDPGCDHAWRERRYYTEQSAGVQSTEAFSRPGARNAARLRAARWRVDRVCDKCGAWLGALGMEPSPDLYAAHLVAIFREVRRVLRDDGVLWLNLGDSYARNPQKGDNSGWGKHADWISDELPLHSRPIPVGMKEKDLIGIPWLVAFALRADGWWLRSDIIWSKLNPMPESVTDRPTKAHEYLFLLTKSARYYYDAEAVKEKSTGQNGSAANFKRASKETLQPGQVAVQHRMDRGPTEDNGTRNLRSVWTIATTPYKGAHFATFPPALVEPCIKAGTSEKGRCPVCGAPWERVVEKRQFDRTGDRLYGGTLGSNPSGTVPGSNTRGCPDPETTTIGWRPGCTCGADPVPCVCLDPFGGAGTVGLVADRLQRDAILIELNPDYCQMSADRIKADGGFLADVRIQVR